MAERTQTTAPVSYPGEYGGADVSLFWIETPCGGDLLEEGTWRTTVREHLTRLSLPADHFRQAVYGIAFFHSLTEAVPQDGAVLLLVEDPQTEEHLLWIARKQYHIEF